MSSANSDTASRWDARIARASELAAEHSPAAGILTFYAGLAEYQRSLCRSAASSSLASDFVQTVDLDAASAAVPDFLAWLQEAAPEPLARVATATRRLERQEWRHLMHQCLTQPEDFGGPDKVRPTSEADKARPAGDADEAMRFVVEAVLQPFAEAAAIVWRADGHLKLSASSARASRCPICSSRPGVGILREEGHGARRTLLCALCLTEWEFLRVVCPACDEQRFDALPVYTADVFSHVRVDACDSCRRYVKTVDLTKNGLAVPLVDDFASVPLDLWAHEQGYRRLRTNLLRTPEGALPAARL